MADREVLTSVAGAVATITLDRPHAKGALTAALLDELVAALRVADQDPGVRTVVVTGSPPAFSVGADLSGGPHSITDLIASDRTGQSGRHYVEPASRAVECIRSMRKPVIGAINGDAIGGGATIAAAMDFRFAAASARFGFVFTRRGLTPEGCSTWLLPRLVGLTRATDWLLSGRVFGTTEALEAGFLTAVVPDGDLTETVRGYATDLAHTTSALAVATTKQLLRHAEQPVSVSAAALAESSALSAIAHTEDGLEGVTSFLERRAARFTSTGTEHIPPWPAVSN